MDTFLDLFNMQGRANRAWYFWHILLDDLVMFTAGFGLIMAAILTGIPFLFLPAFGVFVAGFWAGICITARRLHDIGRPSWHVCLLMVPLYNFYLGMLLLFQKGTDGPNTFGPDPLARAQSLP